MDEITINGEVYVRRADIPEPIELGELVIVRTYSAGVHIGHYNIEDWKNDGQTIILKNARRLWRWRGGNTLNEIAVSGVNRDEYTRISKPVPIIKIVPIEIIPIAEGLNFSEVWND